LNWFVWSTAVLWLFGAAQYVYQGNMRMAIVAVCYSIATFALEGAK